MTDLPRPFRPLPRVEAGLEPARAALRERGLDPQAWSNGPEDRYAAHEHGYTKLLICAAGSITFLVGTEEHRVRLAPGEGFELPPHTRHAAVVGPDGCTCVEGHRP